MKLGASGRLITFFAFATLLVLLLLLGLPWNRSQINHTTSNPFDEESPNQDSNYHFACRDAQCIQIKGEGEDSCVTSWDCGHKKCNKRGYCEFQEPAGLDDQCEYDEDCGHKKCDEDGYCSRVAIPGESQCEDYRDCGHRECVAGYCTLVPGVGSDSCTSDSECGHSVCGYEAIPDIQGISRYTCTRVEEVGESNCNFHEDCFDSRCVGATCKRTPKAGETAEQLCQVDDDCAHLECTSSGFCQLVPGGGEPDRCSDHSECGHNTCSSRGCTRAPGIAEDECSSLSSPLDCEGFALGCNPSGFCQPMREDLITRLCSQDNDCGRYLCVGDACLRAWPGGEDQCDPTQSNPCANNNHSSNTVSALREKGIRILDQTTSREQSYDQHNILGVVSKPNASRLLDSVESVVVVGGESELNTLHVVVDFQCGMCRHMFMNFYPRLLRDYVEARRLQLKIHFLSFGRVSSTISQIALCAEEFGDFQKFLDIYLSPEIADIDQADRPSYFLKLLSYDETRKSYYESCSADSTISKSLEEAGQVYRRLEMNATPSFVLNDLELRGSRPELFQFLTEEVEQSVLR